jgi:hypothetical protein
MDSMSHSARHGTGQPGHHRVVVVVVDGSPESGAALRQAASQARQRNALLDIVSIVPDGTDGPASILARVKLGELTRRECPYGIGVPVRLRVERGDPQRVLPEVAAEAELLINGLPRPAGRGRRPGATSRSLSATSAQARDTRADPRPAGLTGPPRCLAWPAE